MTDRRKLVVHLAGRDREVHGTDRDIHRALRSLLAQLTIMDISYLRRHPETPALYESGVRYQREERGAEDWQTIPQVLRARSGDCEDLATWRAAELRVRHGIKAKAVAYGRRKPDHVLFHIVVRYPDGHYEDPSRRLGM